MPPPTLTFPSPPLTLPFTHNTNSRNTLHPRHPLRRRILSVATESLPAASPADLRARPSPAESSRTILELASTGTLSTISPDGWPLGLGARFVADAHGAPALCLSGHDGIVGFGGRSTFHVQFEQYGARTPQCTLLGSLKKPEGELNLRKLCARWEKKFGEEVDGDLVYVISVERVLQMNDLMEEGVWVASSEYTNAEPDPLRNFAQSIVAEMNSKHAEDVKRLCNVYVDSGYEVTDAKLIWVDRLGFDLYLHSENGVFVTRIPFPREVTDEKGVKSSFNSMSHLAWEIEKNYVIPEFEKVQYLKKIRLFRLVVDILRKLRMINNELYISFSLRYLKSSCMYWENLFSFHGCCCDHERLEVCYDESGDDSYNVTLGQN